MSEDAPLACRERAPASPLQAGRSPGISISCFGSQLGEKEKTNHSAHPRVETDRTVTQYMAGSLRFHSF